MSGYTDVKMNVWWDKNQNAIHVTTNDSRFTDEHGEKPGLRVVFSANPKSADYNPSNFNRCARVLRDEGVDAPDEVPIHSRVLKQRPGVIAALAAPEKVAVPSPGAADPAAFGWTSCPHCRAVLVDKQGHTC
ncbi:hypothetical protein [Ornithinicoccus halotolerans]|uniref:hypothetical protein n=1 Tax=Ornithinicoccus halotolerans TaxID=1748220 RepID=UPI0012948989|nr:hypothetical protein [Ornithinicoccus halotolerans]